MGRCLLERQLSCRLLLQRDPPHLLLPPTEMRHSPCITCAHFAIKIEAIAIVAGAARPRSRVLAVVRAATVVVLAAIDNFHFNALQRNKSKGC